MLTTCYSEAQLSLLFCQGPDLLSLRVRTWETGRGFPRSEGRTRRPSPGAEHLAVRAPSQFPVFPGERSWGAALFCTGTPPESHGG